VHHHLYRWIMGGDIDERLTVRRKTLLNLPLAVTSLFSGKFS